MIQKILNKISFTETRRRYLNLKGIASRRYAYKAPDVIQIDLTDRCNSHCNICWIHSPFVRKEKDLNSSDLDYSVLKEFITDISKAGTKEIIFSGGGEPFSYPQIWEILEFTQKAGLVFRINTNLVLLNKGDINRLLSFYNLISLTVSVWASDMVLYSIIHNRDSSTFFKVKDNLKLLNALKFSKLHIRICTIINSINYLELRNLLNLAAETGCNAIEFGVPDVIPGVTDSFLLNRKQLKFLIRDFVNIYKNTSSNSPGVKIMNKDIFLKRISSERACFGEYNSFIDKIPCYAGWLFLRVKANGDFNSCLKSHRIPIGNIYKDSFFSIWNNTLQQEFREKSLNVPKDKEYFRFIGNGNDGDVGCKRVCDNILINMHLNKIIKYLFWLR